MKGKELAKLVRCIIDEHELKWGKDQLYDSHRGEYCVVGILAKGVGVPDRLLDNVPWPEWVPEKGPMNELMGDNDNAASFLDFELALTKSKTNYPVKSFLRKLKKWERWEKENADDR